LSAPRVLAVSWEYPPVVQGGLARHVARLSSHLAAEGSEVRVLTRGGGRFASTREAPPGVVVDRVSMPDFPMHDLDGFLAWVDRLNDELWTAGAEIDEVDVVHSHDWLVAEAASRLAAARGVPWVVTAHATEHGRHQGRVGRHPQSRIHAAERRMVRCADAVICCSDFMRRHLAGVFGLAAREIHVIPNGVDAAGPPPEDPGALRARFAEPGERLVLLAGRLVYEKGFHVALDALARLRAGGMDVRYVLAGDGPARAELEAQARRLGLLEHGTFLGWADEETVDGLYGVSDVCLVPSVYEPFGLVALEAMAAGCPVVVAATGGLRELVPAGDAVGLRFRPQDPRSLARAAERVLEDDALRARLTEAGRHHAAAYDWAEVARRTAGVYAAVRRSAAAGARSRPVTTA